MTWSHLLFPSPQIALSLFSSMIRPPPTPTLFPYTTLFRSYPGIAEALEADLRNAGMIVRLARALAPERATRSSDRKSTRLNSSHVEISYAVFCLKKKTKTKGIHKQRIDMMPNHITEDPSTP